jgi:hypothetical protein
MFAWNRVVAEGNTRREPPTLTRRTGTGVSQRCCSRAGARSIGDIEMHVLNCVRCAVASAAVVAFATVVVAGCGPSEPPSIEGDYSLSLANDSTIPRVIINDATHKVEVLSGTLTMRGTGGGSFVARKITRTTTGTQVTSAVDSIVGTWLALGIGSLTFTEPNNPSQQSGYWTGSHIVFYQVKGTTALKAEYVRNK